MSNSFNFFLLLKAPKYVLWAYRYSTTKYQVIMISVIFLMAPIQHNKIPGNNYLYVIFLMAPIEHNKIPGNNYLCHFPMAQIQHNKIPSNNDICIIFFHDPDFVTTKYQVIMISIIFLMAQIQHNVYAVSVPWEKWQRSLLPGILLCCIGAMRKMT
jgi:hypothetical protein